MNNLVNRAVSMILNREYYKAWGLDHKSVVENFERERAFGETIGDVIITNNWLATTIPINGNPITVPLPLREIARIEQAQVVFRNGKTVNLVSLGDDLPRVIDALKHHAPFVQINFDSQAVAAPAPKNFRCEFCGNAITGIRCENCAAVNTNFAATPAQESAIASLTFGEITITEREIIFGDLREPLSNIMWVYSFNHDIVFVHNRGDKLPTHLKFNHNAAHVQQVMAFLQKHAPHAAFGNNRESKKAWKSTWKGR